MLHGGLHDLIVLQVGGGERSEIRVEGGNKRRGANLLVSLESWRISNTEKEVIAFVSLGERQYVAVVVNGEMCSELGVEIRSRVASE